MTIFEDNECVVLPEKKKKYTAGNKQKQATFFFISLPDIISFSLICKALIRKCTQEKKKKKKKERKEPAL